MAMLRKVFSGRRVVEDDTRFRYTDEIAREEIRERYFVK